jgi:hypothetical protein
MISYYEGGIKKTKESIEITFKMLQSLIKANSYTELIEQLRALEYGSEEYKKFKIDNPLPCCKPHGTFKNIKGTEILQKLSGHLYFDVDNSDIPNDYKNDIDNYKKLIIEKYPNIISMLGKSLGGKGIFFLIKVNRLTENNFKSVHEYFRTVIFKNIPIDTDALGIARNFFIPLDENLYINENSIATYLNDLSNSYNKHINSKSSNINCTGQYNNNNNSGCSTLTYTFLPFSEVYNSMIKETPVDVGDNDYIIKDILYSKLFIRPSISDGKKHKIFRGMANCILHNNPSFSLEKILSVINYINKNQTGGRPMKTKEMIRTITTEYNRIIDTGEFHGLKNKRVHTNKNLPGYLRSRIANRVNGNLRKNKSILSMQIVVDELKALGINPTINVVADILEGRLGVATIKKYWRIVNPKVAAVEAETSIEHIQFTPPKEAPIAAENAPLAPSLLSRDEFYQKHDSSFTRQVDCAELYSQHLMEPTEPVNTS